MIELHEVAVTAGGKPLLQDIEVRFDVGEFSAVLGPNGVGKTTLLRAIAGLQAAARGTVTLDGRDVAHLRPGERALRVAFVTSDDALTDALSVRDVVGIGRYAHHRWWQWRERTDDRIAVECALHAVGMAELAGRPFATLSSGERQRVWIALGLAQETPSLLLDEPTSHLDVRVAHEILALLRALARGGKAIVCVLHDLNDAAAYADRIALLGDGRLLCAGTPDEVFTGSALERAYGVAMERVRSADGRLRVFARVAE
ncbi:MAG TPA: ABC transporter ATP-binding protein [Candidatus Tumulicola sp.]|nr:ABC transporter ATP-binding protein [Candidatus Tumulicola sp.]